MLLNLASVVLSPLLPKNRSVKPPKLQFARLYNIHKANQFGRLNLRYLQNKSPVRRILNIINLGGFIIFTKQINLGGFTLFTKQIGRIVNIINLRGFYNIHKTNTGLFTKMHNLFTNQIFINIYTYKQIRQIM